MWAAVSRKCNCLAYLEGARPRGESTGPQRLLEPVQRQRKAGFFPASRRRVHGPGLGRFVERGGDVAICLGRFVLLAGTEQLAVILLQLAQARHDAAIVQAFAFVAAHAAFGGLRVRHKSVS